MSEHNVERILEFISFGDGQVEEAGACLSNFASLSENEKGAARGAVIEKIFPLAFGENAVIEGTAKFEELRKSAW